MKKQYFYIVFMLYSLFQGISDSTAQGKLNAAQSKEMTDRHNYWRAQLGISPLVWSDEIASYAQAWADELAAKGCKMKHRTNGKYGENIFWASGMKITSAFVTDDWASERQYFDHKTQECADGEVCGHYTQQIWENTKKIGCGMAKCSNGAEIWVCNYDPAGNYMGEKVYTPNGGSTNTGNEKMQTNDTQITDNQSSEAIFYDIQSLQTNQCLNVKQSMEEERSPVILWQVEPNPNSKWALEEVEENIYKITVLHSGLCLAVNMGKLETVTFSNKREQLWEIQAVGEGSSIKSKANNKYLAVRAGRIVWLNTLQGNATTWLIGL